MHEDWFSNGSRAQPGDRVQIDPNSHWRGNGDLVRGGFVPRVKLQVEARSGKLLEVSLRDPQWLVTLKRKFPPQKTRLLMNQSWISNGDKAKPGDRVKMNPDMHWRGNAELVGMGFNPAAELLVEGRKGIHLELSRVKDEGCLTWLSRARAVHGED